MPGAGEPGVRDDAGVDGPATLYPATLLKLYIYGYPNRVQSSRRLEREAQRNVEAMWLTGKLAPDHKTIANFRKDHGAATQAAGGEFVALCRQLGLFPKGTSTAVPPAAGCGGI